MITQEELKYLFDYHEGYLYWRIKPNRRIKIGQKAGTPHNKGYLTCTINKKSYLVHRLIYLYHHNTMPEIIDHIDQDRSNNKIENLRPASRSLNALNSKIFKNNTSGIKGVTFHRDKRWMVRYKGKFRGWTDDIEEAIKIRKELENEC